MAITKVTTPDIVGVENGITMERQIGPSPGGKMAIFIPRLMPNLSSGSKVVMTAVTVGTSIFINSSECGIQTPSSVRTQNYVEPTMEGGASWKGIVSKPAEHPIPKGTKVTVDFNRQGMHNPTFHPN